MKTPTEEFDRRFQHHTVSYASFGDDNGLERLTWKAPGTSIYAVCFVRTHGTLLVYGDCGEMVYQWNEALPIRRIAEMDLGYFCGKCRAWSDNWPRWGWDPDKALSALRDIAGGKEVEELPGYEHDICQDKEAWGEWLEEFGEELIGSDFHEYYDAGRIPSSWVEMHLEALKRAVAKLSK